MPANPVEKHDHGAGEPSDAVPDSPGRLTGADAVRLHVTLAAGLAVCIGAFVFELLRALDGHTFSWMYVFEWPLLAGFALYMWWNLLHGHDRRVPGPPGPPGPSPSPGDTPSDGVAAGEATEDGGLAAWNRYLRAMEEAEAGSADC